MRRYGFSSRGGLSPFSSTLGEDGVPNVTEDDFSYITSADLEDLEDHRLDIPQPYASHSRFFDRYSQSAPAPAYNPDREEDDVLLINHRGVIYPEHFPAYSIGDGKLLVDDLRERIKMVLELSDRQARRLKLYYKGRRLRDADSPVRKYGVKNKSEILMTLGESSHGSSSESGEEIVVVGRDGREKSDVQGGSPRPGRSGGRDDRSPRDSTSQVHLEVPENDGRSRDRSKVRKRSPSGSAVSASSAPAGVPGGPIDKLNDIAAHFRTNLEPLCAKFVVRPPADHKKREDEHRKLAETIMQQVILKLDEVETEGDEAARARRKELVKYVQAVLKDIDDAKR
ncbi:hypothetical protein VTK56DRAFT_5474 [Thermocarpiscus australiensis]